jgi:cysteine desulfurase
MLPFLDDLVGDDVAGFGNPHSIHAGGRRALAAVDLARERVANAIGAADPSEIVFTSGATEANNWILSAYDSVAVSPFEHSSVREPAHHLGHGILANSGLQLGSSPSPPDLVSIMKVNNEIGTIFQPSAPEGALLHSDATQALGKIPLDVSGLDFASFSGHKVYGPKGVGCLYIRNAQPIEPLLRGGDQENGYRAGTLNVAGIVGMGVAADVAAEALNEGSAKASELRAIVLDELMDLSDWRTNGGEQVSPFILSLSFHGLEGETLVIELDRAGFAISSGAACSARSSEPSYVLRALGVEDAWLRGTIRISFGRFNSKEATEELAKKLKETVRKLRNISDKSQFGATSGA